MASDLRHFKVIRDQIDGANRKPTGGFLAPADVSVVWWSTSLYAIPRCAANNRNSGTLVT